MTIPLAVLAAEWLKDSAFKAEYDRLAPEFEALAESIRAKQAKKSKRPASRSILKLDRHAPPQR